MTIDTGFDDVLAGETWKAPEEITVAVTRPQPDIATQKSDQDLICNASSNDREDIPPPSSTTGSETTPPPTSSPSIAPPETFAFQSGASSPEPAGLTPEGIQAAKSLVRLPPMEPSALAALARDFAMDIKERHVILAAHKLTEAQYDFIEKYVPFYREALHAACIEWHAPLSTQERIKVEAAAILEDSLLGLGARMQSKSEGLPGVIEAAKLFAKVAGVGEREAGAGAPGERFVINIDLGSGKTLTAASSPAPAVDTGASQALQISNDG